MEHPFFTTLATREEALRWLTIAEKLLSVHDLLGSKSFATRARDSDPTLSQTNEILAIVDTLLAGKRRIGNNQPDWYAILRLKPLQGHNTDQFIANQYHHLALLLNPQRNKFPLAEQAFRLVFEAWSVLSNPSRKSMYDQALAFYLQPQLNQLQQNLISFGGGGAPHPLHGSESNNLDGSNYNQVHAQPLVEPMVGGSTREPQNFMGFNSGYNFVFGSGSGSKSGFEVVHNQGQQSYSTFEGNVASASRVNQEQLSNLEKQSQQIYSNVSNETNFNVNVSDNLGEMIEDKEDYVEEMDDKEERDDSPMVGDGLNFWTTCPYCYYMYEYPWEYVDCTLRCQNCKSAFQAVVIQSPPPTVHGQEGYYYCWAFLPFGFSMEEWKKYTVASSGWTPFSPMVSCPQMGNQVNEGVGGLGNSAFRACVDDDEVFVEISDSSESDDDWQDGRYKKEKNKAKLVKGKEAIRTLDKSRKKVHSNKGKNANVQDTFVSPQGMEWPNKVTREVSKVGAAANAVKEPGRTAENYGKLDLNVEFSIETEEPAASIDQGNGSRRGEDDNIEGNGFFEGLDEYLRTFPILNVVRDDKVVKVA